MMNTMKLPVAAALMLGVSALAMPVVVAAQEKEDRPAASEQAKPSQSMEKGAKDKGDQGQGKQDAADRADSPKQKDRSADKGDNERGKADQQKNADRDDKDRSKQNDQKQSEGKSDQAPAKKADTDKSSDKKSTDSADTKKPADAPKEAAKPGDDSKRSASDDGKQGGSAKVQEAKNADLTGDKKEKVKSAFKSQSVKEINNVNVDISVGRRLPRDWEYHTVPTAIIEIVPEYRGYRYVYVEDRYVIVDPDTYEVVYVFDERGGGGSASVGRSTGESGSASGTCHTDLTFTTEDRRFIFEKVHTSTEASIKIGDLRVGATLPGEARVETFPSEVVTRVSNLENCRYMRVEDRIVVVDPKDEKIVAIIED
jgi:hypothetical protein